MPKTMQAASDLNDSLHELDGTVLFIPYGIRQRNSQLIETYVDRDFYIAEYETLVQTGLLDDGVLDLTTEAPAPEYPGQPTPIWPKLIGCWYLTMYHWIPQTSPPLASPARPGIPCGRITPPPKCNFKKTVNFYNKTRQSLHRLRIC